MVRAAQSSKHTPSCCHNLQPNSLLTADYLLLPQFPMPSLRFYPPAQIFLSRLEEEHSLQCCAMSASLSHHFTVHRKLFWGVKEKNRNTIILLREQAKLRHLVWHWNASIIWKGLFEAVPQIPSWKLTGGWSWMISEVSPNPCHSMIP